MTELNPYQRAREAFTIWYQQLQDNLLPEDSCLMHSYRHYFSAEPEFLQRLRAFAKQVATELEPLVMENNLDVNLPKIEHYDAIGIKQDKVIHHPSYVAAGDIIYGSGLMHYLLKPGQMRKTLSLFLLSSHAGEAGHNCPIACSAGIIRVLSNHSDIKEKEAYIDKLSQPSFSKNYTGAQFLTEIQGGSDVGANATYAYQDDHQQWRIVGEKWFCSNANADLILLTARFDQHCSGTKGLGLFLVPTRLANGEHNHFKLRRLKQKIGTRSMATGEIDFEDAFAYPVGEVSEGIHLVMENVLHLSRLFNAFSVLGMARRAYQIAYFYALNRKAFQHHIIDYPLVKETLAQIKAENVVMLASVFYMIDCQDELDKHPLKGQEKEQQLLLRTLANLNKYFTAKRSVENIHHCIDILAGNGTIESFSSLPRLLRDCIVCENWEGTHFTLWMQTLRDIHKFKVDEIFITHLWRLWEDIPGDFDDKALLKDNINALVDNIKSMKTLAMDEQSLHAQTVIEHMASLNAALTLVLELHVGNPPASKKAALILFMQRYLGKKQQKDSKYIALLDAVLG
ncbi:Acyl-CoA dehydrogenase [Legionella lansingensis]|uniref:Short chain-specific acyl CoA dehydrogenase n=1 Tax=Legionella lansingensis TaxID=45067 RepID=A0A0W0VF42_9GAMM|nr:acyl-CoA dehydrogenase family protein [Legionella lansingensis]KTD18773.1 short chain-specific acyl CoA dehydrogenase [Legionella lansingensis]SNV58711.1 Acyl-CoA dehydrogenase [Legionella lansingensis]